VGVGETAAACRCDGRFAHPGLQTSPVGGADVNDDAGAHGPDSHATSQTGIPLGTLPSGFIH
jgi:hypothetical protein